jgi:hypothetical protein
MATIYPAPGSGGGGGGGTATNEIADAIDAMFSLG